MEADRAVYSPSFAVFVKLCRHAAVAVGAVAIVGCSSTDARGERGAAAFPCADRPVQADAAGTVPASGSPKVGNVELPRGAAVAPADDFKASDGAVSAPVLWISDEPVGAAVRDELVERFKSTGLWPVWLEGLEGQAGRPWDSGEFVGGDPARIDAIEAEQWLREQAQATQFDDVPVPIPDPTSTVHGCDAASIEVSEVPINGRLGLIPAEHGADVITTAGWLGPINYFDEVAAVSSVLRTWEDRFGAQVISIGFDTLTVVLTRPPSQTEELEELANEVWLVCPDVIDQGEGSPEALARALARNPVIDCWWD